jgi:hypothetical protein
MRQNSVTIIVPIIKNEVDALLQYLEKIKKCLDKGIPSEIENKLIHIHFARWVVIDHGKSWINDPTPRIPKLVFVLDFDGEVDAFFKEFCKDFSDILDDVYTLCEGYVVAEQMDESRVSFLKKHMVKDAAVYVGAPGRTVQQIKDESELRNHIRNYLDSRSWEDVSARTIHKKIKEEVLSKDKFLFLRTKTKMPGINWLGLILLGLILIALLPLIIIWLLIVHFFYERKDVNFTKKRSGLDSDFLTELEKYEDFKNQNQFTQLVDMKEGKVRLITIKAMFALSKGLIKFIFVQGKLMGIPTIHFAKWVMFEDNSRVLFFSNFDGSWQQYLGDFIDNSGWGLTGIFSNTKVFPKTNFLLTGGAYDEEHFLAWSRNSELVTNVWYTAYPELSIKNVNNNTKIRVQLMKSLSERQAAKFLKLI